MEATVDYDDPRSVVAGFINAMHEWELRSWDAMRAARETPDPSSYQAGVFQGMADIFSRFCTTRQRPHGRQGAFQKPPEYDPDRETLVDIEVVNPRRARVDTDRVAVLGGGRYRYILHKTNDRWLIDRLQHQCGDTWESAIL